MFNLTTPQDLQVAQNPRKWHTSEGKTVNFSPLNWVIILVVKTKRLYQNLQCSNVLS